MWSAEQSIEIQTATREGCPETKIVAVPLGLQVKEGPDGIFNYLVGVLPGIIGDGK